MRRKPGYSHNSKITERKKMKKKRKEKTEYLKHSIYDQKKEGIE